jgi:hypothetical protein
MKILGILNQGQLFEETSKLTKRMQLPKKFDLIDHKATTRLWFGRQPEAGLL